MTDYDILDLGVDIDGVLAKSNDKWWKYSEATAIRNSVFALKFLKEQGHNIILCSARHEEDREITETWLAKHGYTYDRLILGKTRVDYLIDDHVLEFDGNWISMLERIKTLKKWKVDKERIGE